MKEVKDVITTYHDILVVSAFPAIIKTLHSNVTTIRKLKLIMWNTFTLFYIGNKPSM